MNLAEIRAIVAKGEKLKDFHLTIHPGNVEFLERMRKELTMDETEIRLEVLRIAAEYEDDTVDLICTAQLLYDFVIGDIDFEGEDNEED